MSFAANQTTKVQKTLNTPTHSPDYFHALGHGDGSFVPKSANSGTKDPSPCPGIGENDYLCTLK